MSTTVKTAAACIVATLIGTTGFAPAETAATQPAATQPVSALKQQQDEVRAIGVKLREAQTAYTAAFGGVKDLTKLRKPAEIAKLKESFPPLAKQVIALEKQYADAKAALPGATARSNMTMKSRVDADSAVRAVALIALGDPDTISEAKSAAAGSDTAAAWIAKSRMAAATYFTGTDSDTQLEAAKSLQKVLTEAGGLNPDVDLMGALVLMSPSNADVSDSIFALMSEGTPGPFVNSVIRQKESLSKSKDVENKPIVLAGNTVDGKAFTSESMKGKVILVDFWATWCGPCKKELPRIKDLYTKYHSQGLEIIGVSSDRSKESLTSFLHNDPAMSWVQLFEEPIDDENTLHPIAQQYKITGIPRYFLIDRNGILRSAEARKDLEELIPKFLDEKANS